MPWATQTVSTATWTAPTAATQTWGGGSVVRLAWAQPSTQPEGADGGMDFELQARETFPMLFSGDRPLLLLSSLSEGAP